MIFSVIVIAVMFGILRWALDWSLARWGARWRIRGIGDVAVLPLAVLILSILGFVYTPVGNTFTRAQEYEADIFGLNTSRQPDGEAEADLLLGEYRKLEPGRCIRPCTTLAIAGSFRGAGRDPLDYIDLRPKTLPKQDTI